MSQPPTPSTITPLDPLAIQNVLARYCEALDTKEFALLDSVFVRDVVADYPFNSDLKGVEAVRGAIMKRYVHCLNQPSTKHGNGTALDRRTMLRIRLQEWCSSFFCWEGCYLMCSVHVTICPGAGFISV